MRNFVFTACLAAATLLSACGGNGGAGPRRAVYYWSTVLDVDTAKAAFIKAHGVERMYVRYFDVLLGLEWCRVSLCNLVLMSVVAV